MVVSARRLVAGNQSGSLAGNSIYVAGGTFEPEAMRNDVDCVGVLLCFETDNLSIGTQYDLGGARADAAGTILCHLCNFVGLLY